jgi:AraC-like DNA-binding protein
MRRCAPLPLDLPMPTDPRLRDECRAFLAGPRIDVTPEDWARRLNLGVRTLHRRFVTETGTGLAAWRRRACVLHALPQLAAGRPVAAVAADLGYAGPGAFTTMFHRMLGAPPSAFRPPPDGVDRDGVDRDGVDRDGVDQDGVDRDGRLPDRT